ncbi:MAG: hypothetical protein JWO77_2939 [Ilumatobacteraceae bacterium]|nr:hypothetical protein [Ilumatobacteraceae bacterium]
MAKGLAKKDAPPAGENEDAGAAKKAAPEPARTKVGPPLLLVALGFASVLVSLPLIAVDGVPAHVIGYVTGALIPILIIGIVRRVDLDRRRSPYYVPQGLLRPALVALAVVALVAALLHIWPIATELAS